MNIKKICLACREKLRLWLLASMQKGVSDTPYGGLQGLKEMPLLCEVCLDKMIKEHENEKHSV